MNSDFNPKRFLTFDQGVERIKNSVEKVGVKALSERIITSRDSDLKELKDLLKVTNIPKGFSKWQLPIVLDRAQMFISVAQPEAKVPAHVHNEGAGVRFIATGSIIYNGQELTAGDWMYIPEGVPYSFDVGPMGASMFYCYACCCA